MERDKDLIRVGEVMPTTIDKILKQLDSVNLDGMTATDKARLFKELSKKFGFEAGLNVQTLGVSQMIGNTIQFNLCDRTALPELIDKLAYG